MFGDGGSYVHGLPVNVWRWWQFGLGDARAGDSDGAVSVLGDGDWWPGGHFVSLFFLCAHVLRST